MSEGDFHGARRNLMTTCFGISVYCVAGGSLGQATSGPQVSILGGTVTLAYPHVAIAAVLIMLGWFCYRYRIFSLSEMYRFGRAVKSTLEASKEYRQLVQDHLDHAIGRGFVDLGQIHVYAPNGFENDLKLPTELVVNIDGDWFKNLDRSKSDELRPKLLAINHRLVIDESRFKKIVRDACQSARKDDPAWSDAYFPFYILSFTVGNILGRMAWAIYCGQLAV